MGLFNTFGTDKALERQGRWFDIAGVVNDDGTKPRFKMARMGRNNPAYQSAMEKHSKELRQAVELETLTNEVAEPVMIAVFCSTVLLDWEHVQGPDGKEIKFSEKNAIKLFEDLGDLYLVLVEEAKKLSNFRAKELDEAAKKSSQPSVEVSEQTDT
jgi:hypothetical protein